MSRSTPLLRFRKGDRVVYTSMSDKLYPGTFIEFLPDREGMRVQFDYKKDRPSVIVIGGRMSYEGNPFDLEPLT